MKIGAGKHLCSSAGSYTVLIRTADMVAEVTDDTTGEVFVAKKRGSYWDMNKVPVANRHEIRELLIWIEQHDGEIR